MFESWRAAGAAREQADGVVAVLQRELLAPVDHDVAEAHLEAMLLEFAVSRASFAGDDRRTRRVPRAVAGSVLVAGALTFMSGLGAAGALPAPAQHWLSGATRVFGIHLPDRPAHRPRLSDTSPAGPVGPAGSGAAPAKTSTQAPADPARETPTTLPRVAGSASSPTVTQAQVPAIAHGHSHAHVSQTPPLDAVAAVPDPSTTGSNAGGNGKSAAAARGSNAASGNASSGGNAAAAHADNVPTTHAGGNGKAADNGNVAEAHANTGNGNQGGNSAGRANAKPGTRRSS